MAIRTAGVWAGFVLAVGSLTGCAGSGGNSNFQRLNPATARVSPPTATPTATAAANNSAWNRQAQTAATKPQGDPSALAAPAGNTPQFSNQPIGGITPAGGIAPPAIPAAATVPAAPAPGASTSSLLPSGSGMNNVSGAVPAAAASSANHQVAAVSAVRTAEATPQAAAVLPADDVAGPGPTMPPAAAGSELPVTMPKPITGLSPLAPVPVPPTTVRQ
jgi:hypothetical protein